MVNRDTRGCSTVGLAYWPRRKGFWVLLCYLEKHCLIRLSRFESDRRYGCQLGPVDEMLTRTDIECSLAKIKNRRVSCSRRKIDIEATAAVAITFGIRLNQMYSKLR